MDFINEGEINLQLINLQDQTTLNNLEQITFNYNSKIILAIQQSIIYAYFFGLNNLKTISSIHVKRKNTEQLKQIEYLQASNSILSIVNLKILVANLNALNTRKFQLKIDYGLYGYCDQLLLNKNQNNLFIGFKNYILFFENKFCVWKYSKQIITGYRDYILSICLNFEEDELQVYANDSYNCSAYIYIYHKQTQNNSIQWILNQTIKFTDGIGYLWGGQVNHLYFMNPFSLKVFKQDKQLSEYQIYSSSNVSNQSVICWVFLQNKFILLIENNNRISVMILNQQQKLELIKSININLSINKYSYCLQFKSFLQNGEFLIIWNTEKTLIFRMSSN
ncbi:unnamed protein product (macronuclear) [Paramecium tetraurelia]|uniref:Transmembrane protein n=1 Tax=Paramecium tetraurelia TaxID=5888 RepID=A0BJL1_PARTE|nr:uncharacterized protein GSPATT00029356001 [Paramecium tetraurelia]CAK58728.1 unnamed protein product [Paramecium tetraurelia]|eukprot:XP_001426126.1 hypothetical protein (macronuclear) [Paramecium tetraurelia strain d4-2]